MNSHICLSPRGVIAVLLSGLGRRNNSPSPNPLPEERWSILRPALNRQLSYRLLLVAAQQERAFPASGAGVPTASAGGVPPATGLPTHAQATPLLPPPPAAYPAMPASPSSSATQGTPAGAMGTLPSPLNPQPSTPNQPPNPNPLLKIRQP